MSEPMNHVNWFEIPVADLERATAFYEHVFDVTLQPNELGTAKMAMFPLTPGAPGAAGTLMQQESYVPSHEGTMVYFSVGDIEATLAKIEAKGGKILNPKMSIGQYGFVAHFEDCEGNRVALHTPV